MKEYKWIGSYIFRKKNWVLNVFVYGVALPLAVILTILEQHPLLLPEWKPVVSIIVTLSRAALAAYIFFCLSQERLNFEKYKHYHDETCMLLARILNCTIRIIGGLWHANYPELNDAYTRFPIEKYKDIFSRITITDEITDVLQVEISDILKAIDRVQTHMPFSGELFYKLNALESIVQVIKTYNDFNDTCVNSDIAVHIYRLFKCSGALWDMLKETKEACNHKGIESFYSTLHTLDKEPT